MPPSPVACLVRLMAATWPRLLLVLLLLGGIAFASVPTFELVWDDTHLLLHSTVLAGTSYPQIFASDFWLEGERSRYHRPLVTLSYFTESFLFAEARVALLEADDLAGRLRLQPPGWRQVVERVRSRVQPERTP